MLFRGVNVPWSLILTHGVVHELKRFVTAFMDKFPATCDTLSTFTGMHITQNQKNGTTELHQNPYCKNVLERFNVTRSSDSYSTLPHSAIN